MSIRRLDGQTPIVPTTRSTETQASNTVKPAATTRANTVAQSGFTPAAGASRHGPDGRSARCAPPGPLSPTSREGQAAMQATLDSSASR